MVRVSDLAVAPFWKLLGIEAEEGDDGEPVLRVAVEEKLLQYYGKVHGGVLATLVDAATAVAINRKIGPDRGAATVEMKINYLKPVEEGTLYARGEVVHLGRTLAVGSAWVRDHRGQMLAYGTGTFFLSDVKK
ncbi:MAG: PaaI family thioesterase [Bacillota bacterium]